MFAGGRAIGLDVARGVAVLGMFTVHLGPEPGGRGVDVAVDVAQGRSSALFAVLVGVTLIAIVDRDRNRPGSSGLTVATAVLVRAGILLALGTVLTAAGAPVEVILAYYGAYLLLVVPMCRFPARRLAWIAAVWALLGPQVLFISRPYLEGLSPDSVDPLVTGTYPALSWTPLVLAGMAVARMDISAARTRAWLALSGAVMAVLGYAGSWVALRGLPGVDPALRDSSLWWANPDGYFDHQHWSWLLVAAPHSQTTLSVIGNTGVAVMVIVLLSTVIDRCRAVRWPVAPIAAVGSMSLTAYLAHIAGLWLLDANGMAARSWWVVGGFAVVVAVAATMWSRRFRRGPIEAVLHRCSAAAQRIV
ncbi:DUF418 domain-containing protein [Nocardia sp. NPDC050413]|uniref:DUF418 domain-containing protein n=1 Tax=Nocardia sp. NPDC050413 TaxID=3155784 RepID=UPI0033F11448